MPSPRLRALAFPGVLGSPAASWLALPGGDPAASRLSFQALRLWIMARRARTEHGKRYGAEHQAQRAKLVKAAQPGDPCCRCGHPLGDPSLADADHAPGGGQALGLSHSIRFRCPECVQLGRNGACNQSAGGLPMGVARGKARYAAQCIHDAGWPWAMAGPGEPACPDCGALIGGRIWPAPPGERVA